MALCTRRMNITQQQQSHCLHLTRERTTSRTLQVLAQRSALLAASLGGCDATLHAIGALFDNIFLGVALVLVDETGCQLCILVVAKAHIRSMKAAAAFSLNSASREPQRHSIM